ncbi:uncharacterized protein LOC128897254 [Dryobates pubescens]|uniref:uncharacterized protein LOC128897254 n=1 Tax=Dryobates pubescens TaxID=118200 RepID=UPI0023B93EB3|nr:uncharacterized protein LOC128897254 [Dryobates pubescens]
MKKWKTHTDEQKNNTVSLRLLISISAIKGVQRIPHRICALTLRYPPQAEGSNACLRPAFLRAAGSPPPRTLLLVNTSCVSPDRPPVPLCSLCELLHTQKVTGEATNREKRDVFRSAPAERRRRISGKPELPGAPAPLDCSHGRTQGRETIQSAAHSSGAIAPEGPSDGNLAGIQGLEETAGTGSPRGGRPGNGSAPSQGLSPSGSTCGGPPPHPGDHAGAHPTASRGGDQRAPLPLPRPPNALSGHHRPPPHTGGFPCLRYAPLPRPAPTVPRGARTPPPHPPPAPAPACNGKGLTSHHGPAALTCYTTSSLRRLFCLPSPTSSAAAAAASPPPPPPAPPADAPAPPHAPRLSRRPIGHSPHNGPLDCCK